MDDQMLLDTFHIATFDVLFVYKIDETLIRYLSMIEEVFDYYLLMSDDDDDDARIWSIINDMIIDVVRTFSTDQVCLCELCQNEHNIT